MLADIAAAKKYVDLDQYIFLPGRVGQRFIDLFIKKAQEGVRVRMICDAVGSSGLYNSNIPNELSEAGVQIFFHNPISKWRLDNFTSWFFRDHKKILVVDGEIAHTGGVGINDRMADWRDSNVRMTGPIVAEFERVFKRMLELVRKRRFAVIHNNPINSEFGFMTSSPYLRSIRSFRYRKRYLRDLYLDKINNAKKFIYLTTPYFVPDFRLFNALQNSSQRGVDVKLIVPGRSDIFWVDLAAASYFSLGLGAGIKIYRYKNRILHAKTAIIDDWATIGSANLDNLSFWFCYEDNVLSTDPGFSQELKNQFDADLTACQELKIFDWKNRPVRQKVLELITWPAHNFM